MAAAMATPSSPIGSAGTPTAIDEPGVEIAGANRVVGEQPAQVARGGGDAQDGEAGERVVEPGERLRAVAPWAMTLASSES